MDIPRNTLFLQVTFVFTNQVDGKLVPVESIARPTLQRNERIQGRSNFKGQVGQRSTPISQNQKTPPSASHENSSNSTSSSPLVSQRIPIKAPRTLKSGLHVSVNSKPSVANRLSLKRSYPHSVEQDDDFQ